MLFIHVRSPRSDACAHRGQRKLDIYFDAVIVPARPALSVQQPLHVLSLFFSVVSDASRTSDCTGSAIAFSALKTIASATSPLPSFTLTCTSCAPYFSCQTLSV